MEKLTHVKLSKGKNLLKNLRIEIGLSQAEMAQILGVERARLSNLENGKEVPEWLTKAIRLNNFLKEFGYTIDDLSSTLNQDGD